MHEMHPNGQLKQHPNGQLKQPASYMGPIRPNNYNYAPASISVYQAARWRPSLVQSTGYISGLRSLNSPHPSLSTRIRSRSS